jgi:outer membrane protein OmpA-like peptidoglycan-associated protein
VAGALSLFCQIVLISSALVLSTPTGAQTGTNTTAQEQTRFLVYFDAKTIVADAAKRAREAGARRIVVQARASATGRAETNKYLAQTRSSIVTDQLEADGIARTLIQQEPIGQTGSNDPTVTERRVDIIIEP